MSNFYTLIFWVVSTLLNLLVFIFGLAFACLSGTANFYERINKMKKLVLAFFLIVAANFSVMSSANAHTVSLSWQVQPNGDVMFWNQHWHGAVGTPSGSLFINGVEHAFTGVLLGVTQLTGLDGALVNPTYATYDSVNGILDVISNPNFLTVTVSGIPSGPVTFGTTNIALTSWTMPSNGGQITVTLPPPPSVSAPSVIGILALAFGGIVFARRRTNKNNSAVLA